MKKQNLIMIILVLMMFLLAGCLEKNVTEGNKKMIGLTIIESTSKLEDLTDLPNLDGIPINGFIISDEYNEISFLGDVLFDFKYEYSYLEGDIISPDSICAFINGNYYQSIQTTTPIFVYAIYKTIDNTYELILKNEITNITGGSYHLGVSEEVIIKTYNYVLTYGISINKTNVPLENVIREFNSKNQLIRSTVISSDLLEITTLDNTEYVIVEEKVLDVNDKETVKRTLITRESTKNYITVKLLDADNKIKSAQTKILFP
ncbi:MAG TPA: hypothetical protein P5173_02415 [Bacilli bacterium]|nr:hypothetical protein [Bacilli bacterium]